MGRKKRIIDKQVFKKAKGKCILCGEDNYDLLDVHRLKPGCEGGRYTTDNSVSICSNCHRLVHAGEIEIHRYCNSTVGRVLHVTMDGEDKFLK